MIQTYSQTPETELKFLEQELTNLNYTIEKLNIKKMQTLIKIHELKEKLKTKI